MMRLISYQCTRSLIPICQLNPIPQETHKSWNKPSQMPCDSVEEVMPRDD